MTTIERVSGHELWQDSARVLPAFPTREITRRYASRIIRDADVERVARRVGEGIEALQLGVPVRVSSSSAREALIQGLTMTVTPSDAVDWAVRHMVRNIVSEAAAHAFWLSDLGGEDGVTAGQRARDGAFPAQPAHARSSDKQSLDIWRGSPFDDGEDADDDGWSVVGLPLR